MAIHTISSCGAQLSTRQQNVGCSSSFLCARDRKKALLRAGWKRLLWGGLFAFTLPFSFAAAAATHSAGTQGPSANAAPDHAGTPSINDTSTKSSADLVLRNGNILTVDEHFSSAQAVAIRNGRFTAVGSNEDVDAFIGPDTTVLDLQGKTAIPGLLDNHLHQLSAALNAPLVSLLEARSIADVQKAIQERAKATPVGEWVRASSAWHESGLKEGRLPTRWELDEAAPDHPVYIPRGGHVVTVNSRALELAGISKATPNPEGGVIVRNAEGEPTGVLLESAAKMMAAKLPPAAPAEEQAKLLKQFMQQLNHYGVVGVVEPGLNPAQLAIYERLRADGDITVRTHALYRMQSEADVDAFLEKYRPGQGDDLFRIDGVKYLLDGGVEGAYLNAPYQIVEGEQPDPEYRRVLLLPPGGEAELERAFQRLAQAGWQVQTHAAGDATIDTALDIYEKVNAQTEIAPLRWALMHVFLPSEAAMKRMNQMQVLATVQDHAFLLGHNQLRYWGPERAGYAIPIRALLDAGVETSGGTDAPVLPEDPLTASLDRLKHMTAELTLLEGRPVHGEISALSSPLSNATGR